MRPVNLLACTLIAALIGGGSASAADVSGAWATDIEQCSKIYSKRGNQVVFAPKADLYGSGFVIDGSQIRGKSARCQIKIRKEDGEFVYIGAACSTDIAVEMMQFTLKSLGPDKITRVYPGLPELNTNYSRCAF
jgi:hypothetical protein